MEPAASADRGAVLPVAVPPSIAPVKRSLREPTRLVLGHNGTT